MAYLLVGRTHRLGTGLPILHHALNAEENQYVKENAGGGCPYHFLHP